MYTGTIDITFHAERDGDRKRFFELIEESHLSLFPHSKQLQRFVYRFSIHVDEDDPEEIRHFLQKNGVFVLQTQWGNNLWRHKKYTQPYPAGNMTTRQMRKRTCKRLATG